ncbi:hypothetical protein M758_8G152300 [Ceratodon purpureus]|nr:hypothetical protein M758_8G152300 [Ceratodon purpureus]
MQIFTTQLKTKDRLSQSIVCSKHCVFLLLYADIWSPSRTFYSTHCIIFSFSRLQLLVLAPFIMSYNFDVGGSPPSLSGSNSGDFGLEENRLCSFEGLAQAERRRIASEQHQNNNDISFPADAPPKFMDLYVSATMLPSELHFSPWVMNYHDLVDTEADSISGALSPARKRTNSSVQHQNARTSVGNHFSVKSSRHRQLFADEVQNSIENLQMLHDKISSMVALDIDGCGYSEALPQGEKRNNLSPKHHLNAQSTKFEDAVSDFQVSNRRQRFGVDGMNAESSENHIAERVTQEQSRDEGSWHWMSQTTHECLTEAFTAESPVSRVEEGGESEYNGGKRSASTVELEDLLSSLQALLSVLKNHEENKQILQAKMQVLRERKQALHEEKQQYKRQRDSQCRSPLSQETVHVWLAERD